MAESKRMGRKPSLNETQIIEAKRLAAQGMSYSKLADHFKVSIDTIKRLKIKSNTEYVKEVATELAIAESKFEKLPFGLQGVARNLADELKDISTHLAGAARHGSMTAHRLSQIANAQTEMLDPAAPLDVNADALKSVMAFTNGANQAANIGLNLLAANKESMKGGGAVESLKDVLAGMNGE